MHRITDLIKGLAGLTLTLGLLVGLPVGLGSIVGWPLPTAWPGLETVGRHLTDGDIPDAFLLKLIALIVWMAWAQITVATLIEYVTIIRGKAAHRSPTLPAVRLLAAKLATWTTLLVSAVGPIRPAMAAPLAPIPVVAAELNLPVAAAEGPADVPDPDVQEVVASQRYVTRQGDTWWSIAEDLLGDGLRWKDIRTLNVDSRMSDGTVITASTDMVRPGWNLAVPSDSVLPTSPEETSDSAASEIVVEKGDHFWAIADEALTDAWGRPPTDAELTPYWAEIVAANEDRLLPPEDPNLIYPDQRFVLPAPPPSPDLAPDLNGNTPIVPSEGAPPKEAAPLEASESPTVPTSPAPPQETPAPFEVPTSAPAMAESTLPEPAPAPVIEPAAGEDRIDRALDAAKPVGVVAGGIALLGGTLLFTLRRLRHIQAARRRPGTTIDPPDPESTSFERRIRSISVDGEDVRYLAAVNRYLSHQLEKSDTAIPAIVAARAGQFGLELLLDDPCEPVTGFVPATPDKSAWQLDSDLDARMMEAAFGDDAHPFAPALCPVGATDAGNLLVDFEQLGSTAIEGSVEEVPAFQRGLIAALCAAPWGTECEIVAIGIDGLSNDELSRVTSPADPVAWASETGERMKRIASSLHRSPYEERVAHGEVYHPTVVVIGPGAELAGVAQHLAPIADLAYSPLAVISAHPLAGEHRIALEAGTGTIEPLGIRFVPVSLAAAELHAVDHLIANASDTSTSPPAEAWADEIRSADDAESSNGTGNGSATAVIDLRTEAQGDADEAAEASQEALNRIAEIMEPRPVEVTILGRKPTVEGLTDSASAKLEAIIVYLTFHRSVSSERFRDEFWPRSNSRAAGDNAITKVRTLLGIDAEGTARLDSARNSGTYVVSDEVGMDWHRVEALVAAAKGAPEADEIAYLKAACELIDGHVAADAPPSAYAWLLREPTIYTLIETTLVDAAHRCGELALAAGDCELARWAARKGLTIVEGQESLYRMRMQAAYEAGDRDGIVQAFQEAQRAAESYGYAEEVQPETQALFDQLTASPGRGRDTADT